MSTSYNLFDNVSIYNLTKEKDYSFSKYKKSIKWPIGIPLTFNISIKACLLIWNALFKFKQAGYKFQLMYFLLKPSFY